MAGTVKASVLQHDVTGAATTFKDGSGNEIGQLNRLWISYAASTSTTRGSFNVSSVTKNATGDYSFAISIALVDINYSCVAGVSLSGGTLAATPLLNTTIANLESVPTVSSFRISIGQYNAATTGIDHKYLNVTITR